MHLDQSKQRQLVEELKINHGCHTVILYGSFARGEANENSDIDVIGICHDTAEQFKTISGSHYRIGRRWSGLILDAWIYPESRIPAPEQLQHLADGLVLCEVDSYGQKLLSAIQEAREAAPQELSDWDREFRETWFYKMLDRAKKEDLEGNFRRHWLLFDLLESWFVFRNLRYLGSRNSIQWLRENHPASYKLFQQALGAQATFDDIEKLIVEVVGRARP